MSWVDLAQQEAARQNCPQNIALATVDAETGGNNIIGDNGNALGYGQVWPKWHMDAFNYAAQILGLPAPPTDLYLLTQYTLANNQFSMAVTICVIKRMWQAVGGNWAQFTYSYVGPQIPLNDFKRRQAIWNKWNNSNFDYSSYASSGGFVQCADGGDFTPSPYNALGIRGDIPSSNYGVVANSLTSKGYLFGRKYRVIVSSLDGQIALDVTKLRIVFRTIKTIQLEPQYSSIVIYNLDAGSENTIIQQGYRVTIEAGYEGNFGLVFDGNVIQAIRDKEDATTYRLTLIAADSDTFLMYSLSAFSMVRGQNKREALENIVNKSSKTITINSISEMLNNTSYTRGKVFFGLARDYVKQIAKTENATAYIDGGKINLVKAEEIAQGEIFELNPKSGLIEIPHQSDYMVIIKCLINPQIKLNSLLHVDNSLIRTQQYAPGQALYTLDNDGIYRIIQIQYNGDTRGNDWYIEASCIPQAGILPVQMTSPSSNFTMV